MNEPEQGNNFKMCNLNKFEPSMHKLESSAELTGAENAAASPPTSL